MNGTPILMFGASGQVGLHLLQLALADSRVGKIYAPTRRKLGQTHPKLDNPIWDFAALPERLPVAAPQAKIAFCTLGTTMRQAGSKQAFFTVDHDYVLACARLAKAAGVECFVLNSSAGAGVKAASFYLRVKGEVEQAVQEIGFSSLIIVRPSLLSGGERADFRPGEQVANLLGKVLRPLIPARYRPVSVQKVAAAMLEAGLQAQTGVQVLESECL